MKITKTILASVAIAAFAMPMTASAQVGSMEVIGALENVVGPVQIKRGGTVLRGVTGSAVMPFDEVIAEYGGSALVSLNGCGGKFQPCNGMVSDGSKILLNSNNYCGDLASVLPMGAKDAVLTAAATGGSIGAAGGAASIGTALSSNALLAIVGTGLAGWGLKEALENDDEDPVTSP